MNPIRRIFFRIFERSIAMRRSQFEALPVPSGRVLFLGDSITEGAQWDEWFPDLPTLNRGIGGDTVAGVASRLDTAINKPPAISLLIGTNDLGGGGPSRKAEAIATAIESLVKAIRHRVPETPLLLNSVMPRNDKYATEIKKLNARLKDIATTEGAVFIDLWPVLADGNGALRAEFTGDALHLTGAGYKAWTQVLQTELSQLSLETSSKRP